MGCVSSKQAKAEEKRTKGKANGGPVQNGGQTQDEAAQKEQTEKEASVPTAQTDCTNVVSVSQIDVKEEAGPTSSEARKSEKHQSFPARPSTIVKDDSLFSEIESALNQSGSCSLNSDLQGEEGSAAVSSESAPPLKPSTDTAISVPESESAGPQENEEPPPKRPPKPKLSEPATTMSSEVTDRPPEPNHESPPSLPPRTAPSERASITTTTTTTANETTATMENSGTEELPPVLPPRMVPPSPPRAERGSFKEAPPKPRRCSTDSSMEEGVLVHKTKLVPNRKPPPLPDDWAIIELPKTDAELRKLTPKPEQLASMASKYVVNHISLHTQVRVTTEFSQQIYTAFLEVAKQHRSILQRFLTDLIEEQANSCGGEGHPSEPSHGAIMVLLREILRQFVTGPESVVTVSLEILLAVSGVSGAAQSLVECEVTDALLGTMAAHKSAVSLQRYCLDVLAKIALCPPSVSHKAPLEQSAVDLVCLSLESFLKSLSMAQAACRVLDNMVTTLYSTVNSAVDNSDSEEQEKFVAGLLSLMDYVFSKSLPPVRSALKCHDQDMTIKNDGRQFLFIYAKLEQLKQRKKQRKNGSSLSESPPPIPVRPQGTTHKTQTSPTEPEQAPAPKERPPAKETSESHFNHSLEYENWDLLRGVLRKKSSLKGHGYSKADMMFMRQLTKTQVVALVCALAVDSHVQEALELLDQPVAKMVLTKEVPPGVRDFVAHQCTPTHTLIDLDPGLFVSLIDAVRYPSLSFKMAQKCVLEVASALDGEQQVPVVAVTVEFLAATITNRPLAPSMTVPAFVDEVCRELERAKKDSQNSAALDSLLSEIKQCARKTVEF